MRSRSNPWFRNRREGTRFLDMDTFTRAWSASPFRLVLDETMPPDEIRLEDGRGNVIGRIINIDTLAPRFIPVARDISCVHRGGPGPDCDGTNPCGLSDCVHG
jgi:hypothetical protein